MTTLMVFDPPMCCSTGICGPDVDETLITVAADLKWLESEGIAVERFNLSQSPLVFAQNDLVIDALREEGTSALPIFILDGAIVAKGYYPARAVLVELCGLDTQAISR
jgi:hypothetical protein